MRFTKMHGQGNDFVMLDGTAEAMPDPSEVAAICDRHTGVGADGLIVVTPAEVGLRMAYRNADGSDAEMCGNGLRCTAWFGHRRGWVGDRFGVETARGPLQAEVLGDHLVRVEVGAVERVGTVGEGYPLVDVGNPHAVVEVDSVARAQVAALGELLDRTVPGGINTGFVERHPGGIRLRVHERGVGETLACGSGAVAAALVALGGDGRITVSLPGGDLEVEITGGVGYLTGPVVEVFEGVVG